MVSLLGIILFSLMPFCSSQRSAVLSNEEPSDLSRNNSKIHGDEENEEVQLKLVSMAPDVKLKLPEISTHVEHIDDFIQSKTLQTQVRLISPFKLSEQKSTSINWRSNIHINEKAIFRILCSFYSYSQAFHENKLTKVNRHNRNALDTAKMHNIIMTYQFNKIQQGDYSHCSERQLDISLLDSPFNYRLAVDRFVVPSYLKAYRIIRAELLNAVLNNDLQNQIKTNHLTNELHSSVSTLHITLLGSIMMFSLVGASNESSEQQTAFRHHSTESIIRLHERCLTDLQAFLAKIRQQGKATEAHSKTMGKARSEVLRLYNEAKNDYSACWFFCGKLKVALELRQQHLSAVTASGSRATEEADELARKVVNLEQTIDHHRHRFDHITARLSIHQHQKLMDGWVWWARVGRWA
jgi:hypothetical protein